MPKKQDRNSKFKPWRPLVPFQVPPDAAVNKVVACFQNHLATVFIKETTAAAFKDPAGNPQFIAHLMIQWASGLRGTDEYWWGLKMKIKAELCGPNSEFAELGPAAWRTENLKQTHLWVFPEGASIPLGIIPVDIEKAMRQRVTGGGDLIMKEELEVFVVRHPSIEGAPEITEVFASEEECKTMYGEKVIPETSKSGIEMIGNVPSESPLTAWTDAAKVKVSNVLAKSHAANQIEAEQTPELFYENDNPEFSGSDEAELDDSIDDEDAPSGLEEHIAIAEAMAEATKNNAADRAAKVRAVTDEVIANANKNTASLGDAKPRIIIP